MKLLLLPLFTLLMANDYKIATVKELSKMLLKNGKYIDNPDEQLQTNFAFVYYLSSGKVILLPNDRLDKSQGLLFEHKDIYNHYLQNDSFPIPEKQTVVEDRYKQEILSVDTKINDYVLEAARLVSYDLSSGSLEGLLLQLREHNQKRYIERDYFISALVLGEYIRIERNGKWSVMKRYRTFNPYYTPTVTLPSGREVILRDKMELFFGSKISPKNYLEHFVKS
jgi:hypothetical protein